MRRRLILVLIAAAAVVLVAGATLAIGGGKGLIWDDNHYAKPGSLDDGKELLPQTKIPLSQAVAAAQRAADGSLGQVDLEHFASRLVYTVDVGSREVHVDATDGSVVGITPRD